MPRIDDVQQQLQQSIDNLQGQINSQVELIQGQLADQRETQDRANAQLRELITGLSMQVMQMTNRANENGMSGGNNLSRLTRIDFPKFEGEDVQGWVYKCEQFFELDSIAETKKVKIASIHLLGKALVWHQSFMKQFTLGIWPSWENYKNAIVARFGNGPFDDPMAELVKLRQTGSVSQYQEQFDVLINRVELSVTQAVSCFLSGLTEEIQCAVRMFKPSNLHEAYCLAKLQEATLASIARRTKPILDKPPTQRSFNSYRGSIGSSIQPTSQRYSSRLFGSGTSLNPRSTASSAGSVTSKPRRILTPKEIDDKRAQSLCFFCDEKYYPGHKCAGQVYRLEVVEEMDSTEGQEEGIEETGDLLMPEEAQPLISLQALQGLNSFQTMRIAGKVGSHVVHILIDSGSTHNFLDTTTAKRLRCELLKIPPLVVAVADGAQLQCQWMCRGFKWMLAEVNYQTDVYIVPLGSCDMILEGSNGFLLWVPFYGILRI